MKSRFRSPQLRSGAVTQGNLRFSADGTLLSLCGSRSGNDKMEVFDFPAGMRTSNFAKVSGCDHTSDLSPSGEFLCGSISDSSNVYRRSTGATVDTVLGTRCKFSSAATALLLTRTALTNLTLFDVSNVASAPSVWIRDFEHPATVNYATISHAPGPESNLLAAALLNGEAHVWNRNGTLLHVLTQRPLSGGRCLYLDISTDEKYLVAARETLVNLWDRNLATGNLLHTWRVESEVAACVFSPDTNFLAVSTRALAHVFAMPTV